MIEVLNEIWQVVVVVLTAFLSVFTAGHAIIYKRDDRAAAGWVALILLVPIGGAVLYVLLAINRIKRRALLMRSEIAEHKTGEFPIATSEGDVKRMLPAELEYVHVLPRLVDSIARKPLTRGNSISPLENGDAAYPAMLEAIREATRTVGLSTYIFDRDEVGLEFAEELQRAVRRGVEVRVLVDAAGVRYSWPTIIKELKTRGVNVARFARMVAPWRWQYFNLRNHRKLLVVDGRIGFTGGMNIRSGHRLRDQPKRPVQDLHFRIEGPVVEHLAQTFAEDWVFSTKKVLSGDGWFPGLAAAGSVAARGLTDGPDEDFDKLNWTILGAVGVARKSIKIVTPYFLPDSALITALNVAALRGVRVDILIPSKNNLWPVQWAMNARLWRVLVRGCNVHASPAPFDHTKLMVVDDIWSLIGSANLDPRSLRLNFEFNVECYGTDLARDLSERFDAKLAASTPITKASLDERNIVVRLRDGIARLFTPYL